MSSYRGCFSLVGRSSFRHQLLSDDGFAFFHVFQEAIRKHADFFNFLSFWIFSMVFRRYAIDDQSTRNAWASCFVFDRSLYLILLAVFHFRISSVFYGLCLLQWSRHLWTAEMTSGTCEPYALTSVWSDSGTQMTFYRYNTFNWPFGCIAMQGSNRLPRYCQLSAMRTVIFTHLINTDTVDTVRLLESGNSLGTLGIRNGTYFNRNFTRSFLARTEWTMSY